MTFFYSLVYSSRLFVLSFIFFFHPFTCSVVFFFESCSFFKTDFSRRALFLSFLFEFVPSFVHLSIGSFGPIFVLVVLLLLHLFMRSFPFVPAVLPSSFVERIPNSR